MAGDLTVTHALVRDGFLVTARGVVNTRTVARLETAIRDAAGPEDGLIVDLTAVHAPGGTETALLLNAVRRVHAARPRMRLVCSAGPIRAALERTGLARRLDIADRLDETDRRPVAPAMPPASRPAAPRGKRAPARERRGVLLAEATLAIEASYADPDVTLHQIARRIATSSRQLQRVFAEADTTFRAELTAVRMQHAADLLQTSELPVAVIARRVGHRQPAHFTNAFRRHHGLSPTALRRDVGGSS
jgi:anti-anti-sigma factor